MKNTVELLGTYGGDETHALSAWTSTVRDLVPEKINRIPQLLKFLAENGHHTPFEKSMIHYLVDVETASHIHTLKHRIGVSINGESARYKQLATPEHYLPFDWPDEWREHLDEFAKTGEALYEQALESLVNDYGFSRKRAKESARFFLTYANQIKLDVSFNFRSLMHFVGLRHKPEAQEEINNISEAMLRAIGAKGAFKHSLEAFGLGEFT